MVDYGLFLVKDVDYFCSQEIIHFVARDSFMNQGVQIKITGKHLGVSEKVVKFYEETQCQICSFWFRFQRT